jgi:hypothetical protein
MWWFIILLLMVGLLSWSAFISTDPPPRETVKDHFHIWSLTMPEYVKNSQYQLKVCKDLWESFTWHQHSAVIGKDHSHILHTHPHWFEGSFWSELPFRLRGNIGASMSHIQIWEAMCSCQDGSSYFMVLEDDAIISPSFAHQWPRLKEQLQERSDWEILYLGWHCPEDQYEPCRCNRDVARSYPHVVGKSIGDPVELVPMGYAIGCWGYLVRDPRVLLQTLPMKEPVDHHLMTHHVRAYGCVPPIIYHPGSTFITAYDQAIHMPYRTYRSDTQQ